MFYTSSLSLSVASAAAYDLIRNVAITGSNELECIQQRTSAIHEELSAMTPKMADQLSTIRRELKEIQRSVVDLQRRLPDAHHLDAAGFDVGRCRSLRDSRHHRESESNQFEGLLSSVADRFGDGRAGPQPPVASAEDGAPSGPPRSGLVRQKSLDEPTISAASGTYSGIAMASSIGDNTTAEFTLCL